MSDRKRQMRKLLERYRDRAAAITLEMPELQALAARAGEAPAAAAAAPVEERPAAAAPTPVPTLVPTLVPTPAPPRRPAGDDDEPVQERGNSLAAWLAAAVVAALIAGGWVVASRVQRKNSHWENALPLKSAVGLALRGGSLYSFDRAAGRLAAVDAATGAVLSLKRFPNASASGLAASADRLWSADANGILYEHGLGDDYAVRRTFANPNRRPSALHWDGAHLWIADARTNSLYEYTVGASLVPARQFTLPPGVAPVGLHVENGVVWVLDANGRAIRRYRARALLEPLDSMDLKPWIPAPATPAGMVVGEQNLWISSDGPAELHRFDPRGLSWRADD